MSWMCRNLKDIYYSPHNLPEVHDPILFLDKTLFYEKIHFKALFNWTNENHTHDHFSIGKRKPVKSLLTCLVVIWPEQLNILFKDHFVFWHLIQDLFLKNLMLFFLVWWDRIFFFLCISKYAGLWWNIDYFCGIDWGLYICFKR